MLPAAALGLGSQAGSHPLTRPPGGGSLRLGTLRPLRRPCTPAWAPWPTSRGCAPPQRIGCRALTPLAVRSLPRHGPLQQSRRSAGLQAPRPREGRRLLQPALCAMQRARGCQRAPLHGHQPRSRQGGAAIPGDCRLQRWGCAVGLPVARCGRRLRGHGATRPEAWSQHSRQRLQWLVPLAPSIDRLTRRTRLRRR